jgi:hypothetical protein
MPARSPTAEILVLWLLIAATIISSGPFTELPSLLLMPISHG